MWCEHTGHISKIFVWCKHKGYTHVKYPSKEYLSEIFYPNRYKNLNKILFRSFNDKIDKLFKRKKKKFSFLG